VFDSAIPADHFSVLPNAGGPRKCSRLATSAPVEFEQVVALDEDQEMRCLFFGEVLQSASGLAKLTIRPSRHLSPFGCPVLKITRKVGNDRSRISIFE
jgi:hypothetical protein